MVKHDPLARRVSSDAFLGFDFGNKKIGVAVGHAETGIASPLTTIRSLNQVPDWNEISKLITEWQPKGLVVGISKRQDGSDNMITPRMQKFCRQLNGRYCLPVHQIDETLTTFAAKQLLYDELKVNAGKLWEVQDQLAAQLILQSWFNQT
ncbi:Holliday junction resolvase RuvX [Methylomonas sp. MgM2]